MRLNKKILSGLIVSMLFLSVMGFVIANTSDFSDFTGEGHGSCHGSITESANGYISLSSSSGTSVNSSETFIITIQVVNFSEAQGDNIVVGFPSGTPGLGDNKDFTFNTTQQAASISGSGDSATVDFQVTAPTTGQTYTLHSDAIFRASNGSTSYFAQGSLVFTVEDQGVQDDDDDDDNENDGLNLDLIVITSTLAILGIIVIVIVIILRPKHFMK